MKKYFLFFLMFLLFAHTNAQEKQLAKFSFLLGHWEMKTKEGKITEHWQAEKNRLLGKSFKHNEKGDSTLTEEIVLQKLQGEWFFCVTGYEQGNTGTTNFKLIPSPKNTLTFENKKHDFPQRISYQRIELNRLNAWIEGNNEGKKLKIDFNYKRKSN